MIQLYVGIKFSIVIIYIYRKIYQIIVVKDNKLLVLNSY